MRNSCGVCPVQVMCASQHLQHEARLAHASNATCLPLPHTGTLDNAVVAQGVTGITMQFSTFVWLTAASLASGTAVTVAAKVGVCVGLHCCGALPCRALAHCALPPAPATPTLTHHVCVPALQLGAGDAAGAQRTAQIATGTVVASQALVGAVAYYNREYLLKLLSTSAPVIDLSLQV